MSLNDEAAAGLARYSGGGGGARSTTGPARRPIGGVGRRSRPEPEPEPDDHVLVSRSGMKSMRQIRQDLVSDSAQGKQFGELACQTQQPTRVPRWPQIAATRFWFRFWTQKHEPD